MKKTGKSDKVPEPSGTWPVLEHLPLLAKSRPPWRAFAYLANKYGPAFSIRTGSKQSLVVSSCELAKKSFTKNDKNFASRLLTTATKLLAYDYAVFVISPYGRVSELDACVREIYRL
ncbi:cytochrome P450 82C2 [Amborella trichopoda]|uniref:cytochrome P450 82C2 n=1 Tax=Amborella trichopoda TaxID=13333 RepID=UPI0005D305A7|nr:cytochrome P450 82C2 [Amborella trichopoda]|eukprot:XP_011627779.1 cytochrome P450 82C2 [Amborella trichopoda]